MWDPLRSGSVLRQLDHGQHVVLSDQISVLRATEIVRIGIGNLQDLRGQVTLKVVASERVIPGFLWEERKRHSLQDRKETCPETLFNKLSCYALYKQGMDKRG